jgi:hypothetical protein
MGMMRNPHQTRQFQAKAAIYTRTPGESTHPDGLLRGCPCGSPILFRYMSENEIKETAYEPSCDSEQDDYDGPESTTKYKRLMKLHRSLGTALVDSLNQFLCSDSVFTNDAKFLLNELKFFFDNNNSDTDHRVSVKATRESVIKGRYKLHCSALSKSFQKVVNLRSYFIAKFYLDNTTGIRYLNPITGCRSMIAV